MTPQADPWTLAGTIVPGPDKFREEELIDDALDIDDDETFFVTDSTHERAEG